MSWGRPHLHEIVTLDQHNRNVLDGLDHGPQDGLAEARADRVSDYAAHLDEPARAYGEIPRAHEPAPSSFGLATPATVCERDGDQRSQTAGHDHLTA